MATHLTNFAPFSSKAYKLRTVLTGSMKMDPGAFQGSKLFDLKAVLGGIPGGKPSGYNDALVDVGITDKHISKLLTLLSAEMFDYTVDALRSAVHSSLLLNLEDDDETTPGDGDDDEDEDEDDLLSVIESHFPTAYSMLQDILETDDTAIPAKVIVDNIGVMASCEAVLPSFKTWSNVPEYDQLYEKALPKILAVLNSDNGTHLFTCVQGQLRSVSRQAVQSLTYATFAEVNTPRGSSSMHTAQVAIEIKQRHIFANFKLFVESNTPSENAFVDFETIYNSLPVLGIEYDDVVIGHAYIDIHDKLLKAPLNVLASSLNLREVSNSLVDKLIPNEHSDEHISTLDGDGLFHKITSSKQDHEWKTALFIDCLQECLNGCATVTKMERGAPSPFDLKSVGMHGITLSGITLGVVGFCQQMDGLLGLVARKDANPLAVRYLKAMVDSVKNPK
jgi:hypothetical protein